MSVPPLTMANAIRALSMDAVHRAKSGHQGMPLGMADVATVLWTKVPEVRRRAIPHWPDRDRFVLSAGHGSMLLYSLLHLTGFAAMTMEEIKNFRQWGSLTPGHPEYGHTPGVETTTGPLGQGLATAVGMAMAERSLAARYGDELVDHRTWVIAGDGCLMEGVSHEADPPGRPAEAGQADRAVRRQRHHHRRPRHPGRDRRPDRCASRPPAGRPGAIDGHDYGQIARALRWAHAPGPAELHRLQDPDQQGAGPMEGDEHGHGYALFDKEIAAAREAMGWPSPPFVIPDDIAKAWRKAGRRGRGARRRWQGAAEGSDASRRLRAGDRAATCPTTPSRRSTRTSPRSPPSAGRGDARPLRRGAGGADPGHPGDDRRLGRPHRLQQHHRQGHDRLRRPRLRPPLRPLRRARARHGRGDERHGRCTAA